MPDADHSVRTAGQVFAVIGDGELDERFQAALKEIVAALNDRGKGAASLTVKLSFAAEGGVIETKGEVVKTLPKEKPLRSILWSTPFNDLTRANPNQRDMFRDVNQPSAPPKAV